MSDLDFFSLKGKNALIIGGAGSLGKGISIGLAQLGANIIVASKNIKKCNNVVQEIIKETGREAYAFKVDISSESEIEELINESVCKVGHIDILVNSAGINIRKSALEYTVEDWDKVQHIVNRGVFFTCQKIAKHMISHKIEGRIINVSSINAKVIARPDIVSYVVAKAGITQMTKALALEWAKYGITVNAIAPGFFNTELTKVLFENKIIKKEILEHTPMRRFGNPDKDLAGIAIFLASDSSGYMTGQTIYIDGGYTIV